MPTNKPVLPPPLKGAEARKWRAKLANAAARRDETLRSLKFPLDLGGRLPDWRSAFALHAVVACDGGGSLIRLLYTLWLNGFRVFSKFSATDAFRNMRVLDDAGWLAQLDGDLTLAREQFVPSNIFQRILIAPRAVNGKDPSFRAEVIATEYAKYFCKGKHGEAVPPTERALFDAIGQQLAKRFAGWREVRENPVDAARCIEAAMSKALGGVPDSLAERIAGVRTYDPATIAFDSSMVLPPDGVAGVEPHLFVARQIAEARAAGLNEKGPLTKHVQLAMSGDANHGGLSWLFSKGLRYLKTVSIEDFCADYDIPAEHRGCADAVLAAAKTIPDASSSFLGGTGYADYRSAIGGTLGSWIANYINRLESLDQVLSCAVEPLQLPDALLLDERIFEEAGVTPAEILSLAERCSGEDRLAAQAALARLYGRVPGVSAADVAIVEAYNSLVDTTAGLLSVVTEAVSRAISMAEARHEDELADELRKTHVFKTPDWLKRLERLNRLDLSPVRPDEEIATAASRFNLLHEAMRRHYDGIAAWASQTGETMSPLERLAAREAGYARQKKKRSNPDEQAFRACLDMIGKPARRCSEPTLRRVADYFKSQEVFASEHDLNRYFFNRTGMLYKSLYDSNPRFPFAITSGSFSRAKEVIYGFGEFLRVFRAEVMAESPLVLQHVLDLYRLERGWYAMLLTGFPDEIPTTLALPDEVADVFNLPLPILLRLQGEKTPSPVMRKIFNHYYSELEDLAAVLLRPRFFLRAKFARSGDNALRYAPATGTWNAPDRIYETAKPIGETMRRLERAFGRRGEIDPAAALGHLCESCEALEAPEIRAYLRQAPHDWYFPFPGGERVAGIEVAKGNIGRRLAAVEGFRLIGAPGYKGVLDRMLSDPDAVKVSDMAILFDQAFEQSAVRGEDGCIAVTVKPLSATINLVVPVKETEEETHGQIFTRYMAVDLGERGLAYAVFDAASHELVDKGHVKIPSIRQLVKDDRAGKRRKSAINKFRAAYDPAEERRRENIVGDFSNAINRLMAAFDAFPVFEYSGASSSAADRVFAAVEERYLFSSTPTVNAARQSYWLGANHWKHASLTQTKFDKATGKKGTAIEALSLFPGTGVSSYGNSQVCSCCGRNPIDTIRDDGKKAGGAFLVAADGTIALTNGRIRILTSAAQGDRAQYRRRNERTPLELPIKGAAIALDDLLKLARRNLRQAPRVRQSANSTISVYQCLYTDCSKSLNADENAAFNIATKFRENRPRIS